MTNIIKTGVAGVMENTAPIHGADPGSTPRATLQDIRVAPISLAAARIPIERFHYLGSVPGGSQICLGAFVGSRLMGAAIFGCGPTWIHKIVEGAVAGDCLVLTRFWLDDRLPKNSESRVLGIALRALRRDTEVKFVVAYSDPSVGHTGGIYIAGNWAHVGLSSSMPFYDLGDGVARHSRSFSHAYGSHSLKHFARHGIEVKTVPQSAKHRYVYFLEKSWRDRLNVLESPYPKRSS